MIQVNQKIFENYPDLTIGVVVVKGADNSIKNPEVEKLLREAESQFRNKYIPEDINQHPNIKAWQEAHKKFGNDPKRYAPSAQAIAKRVIKGGNIPNINTLVLCRKFNWREADRTKLTEETKNAILVIETLPPVKRDVLKQALKELKELTEKYCGGNSEIFILDKENQEI